MSDIQTAPVDVGAGGGQNLRVILVNSMADSALAITEQRFHRLLQAACPHTPIEFRCVTLPAIPRGEMAEARIARHYATLDELRATPPDALIFSGAEPIRARLTDEIFWPGLVDLFDWAAAENIPSLFSCLAAHAAVLHFAGIERHRLAEKKFGIFTQSAITSHRLLEGMPPHYSVAHSRWNDLRAEDLSRGGYDILTQGANAGVDIFVPRSGAPQIFLQGHPEYEENALLGEYNRDFKRYEAKTSNYKPILPSREDWGSRALEGAAYTPHDSLQAPKPPGISFSGFEILLNNFMKRKTEMLA
jgi:homoserine O-succinyltransferase